MKGPITENVLTYSHGKMLGGFTDIAGTTACTRAATILFSKRKAKENRNEERNLLEKFNCLQEQIRSTFDEAKKAEIDRVKSKLAKVIAKKTQGEHVGMNLVKRIISTFLIWRKETIGRNI